MCRGRRSPDRVRHRWQTSFESDPGQAPGHRGRGPRRTRRGPPRRTPPGPRIPGVSRRDRGTCVPPRSLRARGATRLRGPRARSRLRRRAGSTHQVRAESARRSPATSPTQYRSAVRRRIQPTLPRLVAPTKKPPQDRGGFSYQLGVSRRSPRKPESRTRRWLCAPRRRPSTPSSMTGPLNGQKWAESTRQRL